MSAPSQHGEVNAKDSSKLARQSAASTAPNTVIDLSSDDDTSDYENDHGVMLNMVEDGSGLESGEVTDMNEASNSVPNTEKDLDMDEDADDYDSSASDSDDASSDTEDHDDGEGGDSYSTNDEEGEIKESGSDENDPMQVYSDSHATGKHRSHTTSTSQPSTKQRKPIDPDAPLTLGDLSHKDLKEQLRYYHQTHDPLTVSINEPARCLCCGKPGHMSPTCPARTCFRCQGDHFAHLCPTVQVCQRCRTKGHDTKECTSPLSAQADASIPCALCNRAGHWESRCETLWRTSGSPWDRDLVPLGTKIDRKGYATIVDSEGQTMSISLSCYECGRSGHLGNDCSSRRPGKPMGSTTWSIRAKTGPLLHPTAVMEPPIGVPQRNGIGPRPQGNIGGRGRTAHEAIELDDSDDDAMTGLNGGNSRGRKRPKLAPKAPGRGRGGNTGSGPGLRIAGLANSGAGATMGSHHVYDGRGENPAHAGGGRGGSRGGRGGGGRGGRGGGGYGPQIWAPPASYDRENGHRRDVHEDRYGRGRSRSPPRRAAGGDSYVPMPSAGRDAWRKGRT
jgi:hypothetical protein